MKRSPILLLHWFAFTDNFALSRNRKAPCPTPLRLSRLRAVQ